MKKKVVIIGSGVIGLCSAYYLSQQGHEVLIIDKNHPTDNLNCSSGNMGMIVPSHFIPLASPGIISQGIKWMTNPRSPFYIKPRLSKDFISWGIKFWKSANEQHVQKTAPALKELNAHSLDLFKQIASESNLDFSFQQKGLLMLCKTEKVLEEEIHATALANQLGLETQVLDASGLKKLEPNIKLDVAGAVWYPKDAHLTPGTFIQVLFEFLKKKEDVAFLLNTKITKLETDKSGIKFLVTETDQKISGDEFVLAAGFWSSDLVKQLGIKIPMQAGKGYSLTVAQQEQHLITPSIFCEARVAITPMTGLNNEEKIRFGGTMELGGKEHVINPLRIEGIINSVNRYFPDYKLNELKNAEAWSGLRPCSPDGLPYIGRFKKIPNLISATAHAMMGLSVGPATGEIISDLVANRKTKVSIDLFSPDRF